MEAPYTAAKLNAYLAGGGAIQVTTYLKSTIYGSKHAGWFTEGKDGSLYVAQGRGKVCLGKPERVLVGLRFGRKA